MVSKASRAPKETQETVDLRVPVEVVQQVPKDLRVSKVLRESVASQVLELVVRLVPWGPRESVARWASKVPREILVHLVLKASLAAMA